MELLFLLAVPGCRRSNQEGSMLAGWR